MLDLSYSPSKRSWTFNRDSSLLCQFRQSIHDFLSEFNIDQKKKMRMILCVDEAAANIVKHSSAKSENYGSISYKVDAQYDGKQIIVTFIDNGIPFNPTAAPLVDIRNHVKTGQRGGLGVHIMRTVLDVFHYEYIEGKNVFTLGMFAEPNPF